MKKAIATVGILTAISVTSIVGGCNYQEPTITYQGKTMPFSEAEERIADQLEVENPELDLELDIYYEDEE
jgi:hypothetical protein